MVKTKWTNKENKYLKENYGVLTDAAIARALRRTPKAVKIRAGRMGLARTARTGGEYVPGSWEETRKPFLRLLEQKQMRIGGE